MSIGLQLRNSVLPPKKREKYPSNCVHTCSLLPPPHPLQSYLVFSTGQGVSNPIFQNMGQLLRHMNQRQGLCASKASNTRTRLLPLVLSASDTASLPPALVANPCSKNNKQDTSAGTRRRVGTQPFIDLSLKHLGVWTPHLVWMLCQVFVDRRYVLFRDVIWGGRLLPNMVSLGEEDLLVMGVGWCKPHTEFMEPVLCVNLC